MDNIDEFKIINRKGGQVMLYRGRRYYRQKVYSNKSVIWNCSQKRNLKCTGSITTETDKVIRQIEHKTSMPGTECNPNIKRNELDLVVEKMKQEASTSADPLPKIYTNHITPLLRENDIVTLPNFEKVKGCLNSARKKAWNVKKVKFQKKSDVEVPKTLRELSLLADFIEKDSRILIFFNTEVTDLLPQMKEFFLDATFKSVPDPFYQLFSIHGDIGSSPSSILAVPIFYALMSDKKEASYFALFDIIKTVFKNEWNPITIHMDFEIAASNGLKKILPDVVIKRCYYHFNNCIWKKAKSLGIKHKLYRRIVGLCAVLPLVPIDKIGDGWKYIQSRTLNKGDEKLNIFMAYVKKTWMKNPIFINEWCVSQERHRTNNIMESWHSLLNKSINKNYVTLAKLLELLQQNVTIQKIKIHNKTLQKRRKIEIEKDDEIIDLQMQLVHGEISVGHYLEALW